MSDDLRLPKGEMRGEGIVRYRCATCGDLMDPEGAVLVDGMTYHPEHTPKEG